MYGEIIIGPPGSGKSTYVQYKKEILKERDVFTINLDPGNNKKDFDYDIKQFNTTRNYMEQNSVGPNYSAKCILREFLNSYDYFLEVIRKNDDKYFIFDFPGQLEFFMCDDTLRFLTRKLQKEGFNLVVVHLIDVVFFIEPHCILSSYMFCTISMILLELPHVSVVSKCDNIKKYEKIKIRDILEVRMPFEEPNAFYESLFEMIENESLLSYEILDYENIDAMMYLQMIVDKASGFLFNEEPVYEQIDKETIVDYYSQLK